MPLYDITCDGCGYETEIHRSLAQYRDLPDCEHCAAGMMRQIIRPTMICSDIEPYQAVAVDKATGVAPVITSRREHREFMERNGYRVAEGLPTQRAEQPVTGEEIKTAIEQVEAGKGAKEPVNIFAGVE